MILENNSLKITSNRNSVDIFLILSLIKKKNENSL